MEDERKTERKRKRFAARLKVSKGIICTETAGPNIVLCNAGRATGFDKDTVINLLNGISKVIQRPKFIDVKGESHSFLIFRSTEDAVTFFNACHGKGKADKEGTPIYLNFVETVSVPKTEVICPHDDPVGLTLLSNFITKDEERQFIQLFDWSSTDASTLKNRQVKHYGYAFRYGSNDVDLDNPLSEKVPLECDMLWKRLDEQGFCLGRPDQLTVNKYSPGHGIPSHVDKHSPFGDTILSLTLGSSVVMNWKHHSGKNVPVVLPARSMLIMQGEARYDWQHGIQHSTVDPIIEYRTDEETQKTVKIITRETRPRETRISLTFRWTRSGPCECAFKTLCDTGGNQNDDTELEDSVASNLEELHVHQVYEQIACHFSRTRHTPWPRVVAFVRDVAPGTIVLDLGAGNGKNILRRSDILQIAGERSGGLLRECAAHARGLGTAACVRLDVRHAALRDRCADRAICIAVIHHMSTRKRRIQAISTIHRLLRSSGRALITVWAKDQSKSNYLSKNKVAMENERVNVNGVNLHIHENRTQFQHKDLLVPWKLKTKSNRPVTNEPVKSDNSSKSGNKSYKSDKNASKYDNHESKYNNHVSKIENSPELEYNSSKIDSQLSKSNDHASKNDKHVSENENSSKSEYNSSNIDSELSKSDDDASKNDNHVSKNQNSSKSEYNSSKIGSQLSKSNDHASKNDKHVSENENSSKSEYNSSKIDSQLSKSNDHASKNDNHVSKNQNSSKSEYNSSKIGSQLSKSNDHASKNDKHVPKNENIHKSDEKSKNDETEGTDSTLLRFYHVFEEGELDELCKEVGFEIESTFYEEGNWCVICKKVQ